MKQFEVGSPVVFIDSQRRRLPALVQCIHGTVTEHEGKTHYPCVNLVFVSGDPNRTDNYGRQIEHVTSIGYWEDQHPVVGFCWHFPDEDIIIREEDIATQK